MNHPLYLSGIDYYILIETLSKYGAKHAEYWNSQYDKLANSFQLSVIYHPNDAEKTRQILNIEKNQDTNPEYVILFFMDKKTLQIEILDNMGKSTLITYPVFPRHVMLPNLTKERFFQDCPVTDPETKMMELFM